MFTFIIHANSVLLVLSLSDIEFSPENLETPEGSEFLRGSGTLL